MDRVWSKEQSYAINDNGGTLLVSAAAGSGKTAVLVERIIERITKPENNTPADRILVVTFSNAAANEMKERITKSLANRLKKDPYNSYIRTQQMLLERASISTIHSFCLDLIRKNFNLLDISPSFKIGDEKDIQILTIETIKEILEEYYAKGNKDFLECAELIMTGKDDKKLVETVETLYKFIRSHPFYSGWLDRKLLFYNENISPENSPWGEIIFSYAIDALNHSKDLCQKAISIIKEDDILTEKLMETFYDDHDIMEIVLSKIKNKSWDDVCATLKKIEFKRFPTIRGYSDSYKKDFVKNLRDQYKKVFDTLSLKLFCTTSNEYKEDMIYLKPKIKVLFDIVMELDKRLSQKKKEKRVVDFSDLEHYTLELLVKDPVNFEITPIANELKNFYKMVVIDEYQDTNEAQEMIFRSISNDNVFMVGDVKQSIYRFRQAMPEIFLRKKQLFNDYDGKSYPAKIIFNKNFRSRVEVTDSINYIFEMIMSERMGEIDYTGEEKLYSKAKYIKSDDRITEIHLIPQNDIDEEKSVFEAKYTARKIKELLDSDFLVQDGDKLRKIVANDICILMRSPKDKAETFVSALADEGINSFCDVRESFLKAREISAVVALLKTVTNPLDDIAVVGTMMSPIFAFSADEIAEIRAEFPKGHIYPYLMDIAKEDANSRVSEFVNKVEEIRGFCETMSSADALGRIFKITDYYGIVGAMNGGEQRLDNLHLLISYAKTYERYGHSGISGFVSFINKMLENSLDMQSSANSKGQNGVNIMSIHRSKGLEFSCIFLCDTAKKFNKQDINRDTVLHSYLGFGAGRRDFEKRSQYTTVPLEADKLELTRSMLSEELRILYVALTRAKEKLFIIGSVNDIGKKLANLNFALSSDDKISAYNVREAESYLDWILMPLIHHIDSKGILGEYLLESQLCEKVENHIGTFKIVKAPSEIEELNQEEIEEVSFEVDEQLYNRLFEIDNKKYDYERETILATKVSVSNLIKSEEEKLFSKEPSFIRKIVATSAQKGLAFHSFMLYADHKKAIQNLDEEKNRLVSSEFITSDDIKLLNDDDILAFYRSNLFKRMQNSSFLKKEMRFMAQLSGKELEGLLDIGDEEQIVVQGISDVVFSEGEKLIIADYKTDNVKSAYELIERYKDQLCIYEKILSKFTDKKEFEKVIYSVKLREEIVIK